VVKVTKESVTSTEVTLNIEMDSSDEDPFIDRSYRRSVGRIQIPGFRKGKAPRSIVERYVGRTALLQEALEFMIPETLDRVLKDEDLQAFVEPQIELTDVEPVSFKAVVPLEPLVVLGDYRAIRVEQTPVEITEEQVDDVIERLRQESAPWEPADRPVRFGDLLNLEVRGTIDGEEVVNDQGVDYIPQLENLLPFPGFGVYLEGMTEGQEKDFTLSIPQDYPRPQFAGKECRFHVAVRSIKEKKLPDRDDEFAKGVGEGFDTFDALQEHVRGRLTEESEAEAARQLASQSLEQLVAIATIEASDTVYQRELEMMHQERARLLQNQRLDMDTYLTYIGKTEEEFLDELRPNANERLTRYLVMRKLSQEEDISVSDEEVQEEVETAVASAGDTAPQMRRTLSSGIARENIRSSILNRKVMQRLVEIARGMESGSQAPHRSAPETEAPETDAPETEARETDGSQLMEGADGSTTVNVAEHREASTPVNFEETVESPVETNGGA
jgi:trigger factor